MTATMITNGQIRKNLASQLDRLDSILDGLADGLGEAVVTAVREAVGLAVQEAVRAVLTEVLTNPDLLDRLRGRVAPPAQVMEAAVASAPVEPLRTRLTRGLGRLWSGVGSGLRTLCQACGNRLRQARESVGAAWIRLQGVRRFKSQFLIALAIGTLLGVTAYFAGPWLAAAASGVGGFATTVMVQAGLWLRRLRATVLPDAA
jgi:hypothetical protein